MWSLVAAGATLLVGAVVIAILDIFLAGHGFTGLAREAVTWDDAGVHLSIGDVIAQLLALCAGVVIWVGSGKDSISNGKQE